MGSRLIALLVLLGIALLGTWATLAQPESAPDLIAALPLPTPTVEIEATAFPSPALAATEHVAPTPEVATSVPTAVPVPTSTTPPQSAGGLVGDVAAGKMGATQCIGCHSVDGSTMVGPSWKAIYGTSVELESGETVIIDDAYLARSITDPLAEIVKGFPPAMPPYTWLTEQQIADIIAYIKSLE